MEKKPIITQSFFCIKSNHMNNLLFLIISIDIFVHLPYYTTPAVKYFNTPQNFNHVALSGIKKE